MAGRLVIDMAGILFIISAPSGSGKSTLVSEVRRLVEGLEFSISYTTRQPRGSEENGKEYWFTNHAEFERMIDAGEFLEWAKVFGSNYYGTAVSALEHARTHGHDLLLDIDVQGALQVMKKVPEAVSIFILPPSPQVLEMRLRNRSQAEGVTDEAVIEERLSQARNELRHLSDYKYALINDQLDQAASEMRAIVLHQRGEEGEVAETAARCLTSAHSARLDAALTSFQVSTAIV
ncbi:guanylate kinase [Granulicella mallensis]|uniref:Guanylate kinase n=1 Tax=Granulicella mallensis (strain ATCC BAA-1857 / DSM 23137 / MP5ACTX8) TaxID=682795 RepID=G8NS37_GRAMM|nr:guanylate kinase [Granulicella mallensis]AEU36245.1 guanylate kinase [Granulicella mallensis MP5ACTX8]